MSKYHDARRFLPASKRYAADTDESDSPVGGESSAIAMEAIGISSASEFPIKHAELIDDIVRGNGLGDLIGVSFRGGKDPMNPTIEIVGTRGIVELGGDLVPISSRVYV